jgi:hypothetical protein
MGVADGVVDGVVAGVHLGGGSVFVGRVRGTGRVCITR